MTKDYRKALENLDQFLADTEGMTSEQIAKELREEGVDVREFLGKVERSISKMERTIRWIVP